jgi:hypothetical protein
MNRKHNYILVKQNDFINYEKKYGHTRLDKWNRLFYPSKNKMLREVAGFIINEEIFDGELTNYDIKQNGYDYLINFKTNSGVEYRFDLSKEPNIDKNIYHLSFSLFNIEQDNYNNLTQKKESFEVLNRLIWILKDVVKLLPIDYEFCIGLSEDERRNSIYSYMMRGITNWERRDTIHYDTGWGIYFKLD